MTDDTAQNKTNLNSPQTPSSVTTTQTPVSPLPQVSVTAGGKEQASVGIDKGETLKSAKVEAEIPKNLEKAGVTQVSSETLQISQDLQNIGVQPTGLATPVPVIEPETPEVKLPVEDETVLLGLHADVASTLRWLALWCIRKLAKAHVVLQVIHGKIKRVRIK